MAFRVGKRLPVSCCNKFSGPDVRVVGSCCSSPTYCPNSVSYQEEVHNQQNARNHLMPCLDDTKRYKKVPDAGNQHDLEPVSLLDECDSSTYVAIPASPLSYSNNMQAKVTLTH